MNIYHKLCAWLKAKPPTDASAPKVLTVRVDDKGWVRLVRVDGSDAFIGETAVRSRDKNAPANLEALIRYLMRRRHTSPFEFMTFTFDIYAPITVAREIVRHRTASWSEMSGRMAKLPEPGLMPIEWRKPSAINKQSSVGALSKTQSAEAERITKEAYAHAYSAYESLNELGVALELSRNVLPVGGYTYWRWQIDLHNLFGFLQLRLASDTMAECRAYAEVIAGFVKEYAPLSWGAFNDYRLNAVTIPGHLKGWVQAYIRQDPSSKLPFVHATKAEWTELLQALQITWTGEIERAGGTDTTRPVMHPVAHKTHTP